MSEYAVPLMTLIIGLLGGFIIKDVLGGWLSERRRRSGKAFDYKLSDQSQTQRERRGEQYTVARDLLSEVVEHSSPYLVPQCSWADFLDDTAPLPPSTLDLAIQETERDERIRATAKTLFAKRYLLPPPVFMSLFHATQMVRRLKGSCSQEGIARLREEMHRAEQTMRKEFGFHNIEPAFPDEHMMRAEIVSASDAVRIETNCQNGTSSSATTN